MRTDTDTGRSGRPAGSPGFGVLVLALVLVVVLVGLGSAGVTSALPSEQVLVVEDAETDERLLATPLTDGSEIALEYTHSVERSRVLDVYQVRDGRLEMTRMEFESYGAGLPAGADVRVVDGRFVFDPRGSYEELYVKPGHVAGHRLHVDDETHDLVALSSARTVRLHVERRSVLESALRSR